MSFAHNNMASIHSSLFTSFYLGEFIFKSYFLQHGEEEEITNVTDTTTNSSSTSNDTTNSSPSSTKTRSRNHLLDHDVELVWKSSVTSRVRDSGVSFVNGFNKAVRNYSDKFHKGICIF